MKTSEMRDKNAEELQQLETDLRDQLVKLSVAKATQRVTNTSQFRRITKDIARVLTIQRERVMGLDAAASSAAKAE
ncbi:MAG: 50S ribosomal protein L29 [Nannocystaceae bacterium]|nr:50S ribosomal protein L29 [Nannocystaceae bacterium]